MGYDKRFGGDHSTGDPRVGDLATRYALGEARAQALLDEATRAALDDPYARSVGEWCEMVAREQRADAPVPGKRTAVASAGGGTFARTRAKSVAPGRATRAPSLTAAPDRDLDDTPVG